MKKICIAGLLILISFQVFCQEEDIYESYYLRLTEVEETLTSGAALSDTDLTEITDLTEELAATSYSDLQNKAELLLYLVKQNMEVQKVEDSRDDLEDQLTAELKALHREERSQRRKEALVLPAVITGGLAFIASDLSFILSDAAYSEYLDTDDPRIGGYYQNIWESLEISGILSWGLGLVSVLYMSGTLSASEASFGLGSTSPEFQPTSKIAFMDPVERSSLIEEKILTATDKLEKSYSRQKINSVFNSIFLGTGICSMLVSGVSGYLASSAARNLEDDPDNLELENSYNLYNTMMEISALSGAACLSGSLLLQIFRPHPEVLERKLTDLKAYQLTISESEN